MDPQGMAGEAGEGMEFPIPGGGPRYRSRGFKSVQ